MKIDALNGEKIASMMNNPIRISLFDSLDSTNSEARRQVESGLSTPALILAEGQSAGRGRLGRDFYSPRETGLYMSFLAEAKESFSETVKLTTATSVAVSRTIEDICGESPAIKWVNDVYMRGKKVCGILCESFFDSQGKRFVVIGVGINLYTDVFPDELELKAASVSPPAEMRNAFAAGIADRLIGYWQNPIGAEVMEYYRSHSLVLGKRVAFFESGVWESAVAESVDDFGGLDVRLSDGRLKKLSGGEITLRLENMKEI